MRTLFVVADVHGFYDELIKALDEQGFDKNNKDHIFVSCGDLLDRGTQPKECLRFVNSLPNKILIRGNHEDLLQEAIYRGSFLSHDYHNGTADTVERITDIKLDNNPFMDFLALHQTMQEDRDWNTYFHSCIDYYETEDYVFVHGWLPIDKTNFVPEYLPEWRDYDSDWAEARWLNGINMWHNGIVEPNKTIVCGHWHSSYGNSVFHNKGREFEKDINGKLLSDHTPFIDDGIIALDSCAAYSGFINCIRLEVEDE